MSFRFLRMGSNLKLVEHNIKDVSSSPCLLGSLEIYTQLYLQKKLFTDTYTSKRDSWLFYFRFSLHDSSNTRVNAFDLTLVERCKVVIK